MESFMGSRRIFATFVVIILLCASSLAMACDLSCEFAQPAMGCHSFPAAGNESMPAGMAMGGMTMPGMNNPGSGSKDSAFGKPVQTNRHAEIGEMDACERQSCDLEQIGTSKANPTCVTQFGAISNAVEYSRLECIQFDSHDARDGLELLSPPTHPPLTITLRI
jgi:hypothetical protein